MVEKDWFFVYFSSNIGIKKFRGQAKVCHPAEDAQILKESFPPSTFSDRALHMDDTLGLLFILESQFMAPKKLMHLYYIGSEFCHVIFNIAPDPFTIHTQTGELFFENIAESGKHFTVYLLLILKNSHCMINKPPFFKLKQGDGRISSFIVIGQCL